MQATALSWRMTLMRARFQLTVTRPNYFKPRKHLSMECYSGYYTWRKVPCQNLQGKDNFFYFISMWEESQHEIVSVWWAGQPNKSILWRSSSPKELLQWKFVRTPPHVGHAAAPVICMPVFVEDFFDILDKAGMPRCDNILCLVYWIVDKNWWEGGDRFCVATFTCLHFVVRIDIFLFMLILLVFMSEMWLTEEDWLSAHGKNAKVRMEVRKNLILQLQLCN